MVFDDTASEADKPQQPHNTGRTSPWSRSDTVSEYGETIDRNSNTSTSSRVYIDACPRPRRTITVSYCCYLHGYCQRGRIRTRRQHSAQRQQMQQANTERRAQSATETALICTLLIPKTGKVCDKLFEHADPRRARAVVLLHQARSMHTNSPRHQCVECLRNYAHAWSDTSRLIIRPRNSAEIKGSAKSNTSNLRLITVMKSRTRPQTMWNVSKSPQLPKLRRLRKPQNPQYPLSKRPPLLILRSIA